MNIPSEYDEIRPYEPEELPEVFKELLADSQFLSVVNLLPVLGDMPQQDLQGALLSCKTNLDFQKRLIYPILKHLLSKAATSYRINVSALADKKGAYTYISNHRDIVLDSAILSLLLLEDGFEDTVEIAIGDNLLAYPWIEKIVRVNRAFIVRRSLGMREMLASSKRLSGYIHFAINEKKRSLWIAQREGRAKDSNDRTQESLIKMLAMAGNGSPAESLSQINIVPLSISYEYDPCDFLKAKEMQQKRDNPAHVKSREDDLLNMQTGIFGFKGDIHYQVAPCINAWLPELAGLPKGDFFAEVVRRIDKDIHSSYKLFPGNYVAADLLDGTDNSNYYTPEEKARFEKYLASRVKLVDLPDKDEDFLRNRILEMYANPLKNYIGAKV